MADLQTITIASGSGHVVEEGITKLRDDLIKAANNFADTADPAATTHGRSWYRTDEDRFYYRDSGGTKTAMLGPGYKLYAELDCNLQKLKGMRLKDYATGSLPAAGAGEDGAVRYDSTKKQAVLYTDAGRFYVPLLNIDATDYFPIPCDLNVTGSGTPATAGTTRWGGWVMDADSEELNWVARYVVPDGWTGANDLLLEVEFYLSALETANDDVDLDCNWHSLTHASGDAVDKTYTAATQVNYDIGASAVNALDKHKTRITLAYNDATNPIAAGDAVAGYILRTTTVGDAGKVAGIVVTKINLLVPVFRHRWL